MFKVQLTVIQTRIISDICDKQSESFIRIARSTENTKALSEELKRLGVNYNSIDIHEDVAVLLKCLDQIKDTPDKIFSIDKITKDLLKAQLFNRQSSYPKNPSIINAVSGLWKKLFISEEFKQYNLN